jgi:hypothetical protein
MAHALACWVLSGNLGRRVHWRLMERRKEEWAAVWRALTDLLPEEAVRGLCRAARAFDPVGKRGQRRGKRLSAAHCGTESGAFEIKGLAARIYFAFTLSSPPAPAVTPASLSPAPMARIIRGRKRAGERRAGHAGPLGQCARP